ncbi:MAG TPA: DUF6166 domain-containing protein [Candidatus Binatia bacterium]|jgi:hypothetical protein|nr:DUF6166 domain-containing protein [Candidatus Binatia bacterium]
MKTYVGVRNDPDPVTVEVHTSSRKRPLRHIPFHSPSGFEWGFQGSGPADLALSILVDYLKERPPYGGWKNRLFSKWTVHSKAWKYHQDFKRDFVAKWSVAWMLHDQEIDTWLKEQEEQDADSTT